MISQIDGECVVGGSVYNPWYIEPFACLNGALHDEMVLQSEGECVVHDSV